MTKKNAPLLSLSLNVYNEEENLEIVYKEIREILRKAKISYEIIFVEGGSHDNSWKILQNLAKKNDDCRVYQADFGPGQKINAGMKVARGKYFGYMCSDGQDDPKILPKCIQLLEENKADFVKGRRIARKFWQRIVMSRVYNRLADILFGLNLNDINMHPKVFRRELIQGIDLISPGESVDLEIVLRAHQKGYKIIELPVKDRVRGGGTSSVNSRVALNMSRDILSYKWGKKAKLLQDSIDKRNAKLYV
ncbi:MAG TPA: glycosyltransferase family 2 protein [Candidatus Sulfotelmatobacter sp.]|jgi:glycosyltransferase involved in cell wall biosynthesis|nr:glycosyltransferase family 2 protein [Candidatus Sulfotelmatobacter sp.]